MNEKKPRDTPSPAVALTKRDNCQCITYTYMTTMTTYNYETGADPRLTYAQLHALGLVTSPMKTTRVITQRRYDPIRNTITDHKPFTGDISTIGPLKYTTWTRTTKMNFPDYLAPVKWVLRGCGKAGVVLLGSSICAGIGLTRSCIDALELVAAGLEGGLVAIGYTSN